MENANKNNNTGPLVGIKVVDVTQYTRLTARRNPTIIGPAAVEAKNASHRS